MAQRRVSHPIAIRRYGMAGEPGREVVLTIGKPRPDPKRPDAWVCTVLLEGLPKERRRLGHGIDAVQALQDAMMYARYELDRCRLSLTWLDGESDDYGLPRTVPSFPGTGLREKIEAIIDRQLKRFANEAKKRHKSKRALR